MKYWRKVVFSRVENWWNVGSKNGKTRGWATVHPAHRQVCHWWRWHGLRHCHRIRHHIKVTVILAQGEWSIAKDIEPIFKKGHARHWQTFFNLENVYVFNIGCICTHRKRLLRKLTLHEKKVNDLTSKQMFDTSEKLIVGHSDETFGVTPINCEDSPWKPLSLVSDEEIISLSHSKMYVFSDSVLCLGKVNQSPTSNIVWEEQLGWFKEFTTITIQNFGHNWRRANEIRVEYFPGFTTLQLINRVHEFMTRMSDPSQFKGRIKFKSIFNDILWESEDNDREWNADADLVSFLAKNFPARLWSFKRK